MLGCGWGQRPLMAARCPIRFWVVLGDFDLTLHFMLICVGPKLASRSTTPSELVGNVVLYSLFNLPHLPQFKGVNLDYRVVR
jgi:hypothetical protein